MRLRPVVLISRIEIALCWRFFVQHNSYDATHFSFSKWSTQIPTSRLSQGLCCIVTPGRKLHVMVVMLLDNVPFIILISINYGICSSTGPAN